MNAVRLGNVVGSTGSVVPIFLEQISRGGPVTVTHPETSRYFMSLEAAVEAILAAGAAECAGRILLPDLGEPERIADLARFLIGKAADGSDKRNPDPVYRPASGREAHRRSDLSNGDARGIRSRRVGNRSGHPSPRPPNCIAAWNISPACSAAATHLADSSRRSARWFRNTSPAPSSGAPGHDAQDRRGHFLARRLQPLILAASRTGRTSGRGSEDYRARTRIFPRNSAARRRKSKKTDSASTRASNAC